jgi:hypothetical protein
MRILLQTQNPIYVGTDAAGMGGRITFYGTMTGAYGLT